MSSDTAISIRGLSKSYTITHTGLKRPTFRDVVMDRVRRPFHRAEKETFWALKDVSFDVKQGEVVGIIGRNGAGKSTLLKILSRITEPTSGRVEVYGRVGSLLEVGTGFHPELSGRENIYLNGAILGMTRGEIRKQFDAIVDFAEVEKFLDTPVKRYSSGMYVRLAFAVAAHLNPEILVVDEVLAVGDAEFQKKCLRKMGDLSEHGRTILLVSHNMAAIRKLCSSAFMLAGGVLECSGPIEQVVDAYDHIPEVKASDDFLCFEPANVTTMQLCRVTGVEVRDETGAVRTRLRTGDCARFRVIWESNCEIEPAAVEFGIHTTDGIPLIQYSTKPVSGVEVRFRRGRNMIELVIPALPLAGGDYNIAVGLTRPMAEWLYREDRFARLHVVERDYLGSGLAIQSTRCVLAMPHSWHTPTECARYSSES